MTTHKTKNPQLLINGKPLYDQMCATADGDSISTYGTEAADVTFTVEVANPRAHGTPRTPLVGESNGRYTVCCGTAGGTTLPDGSTHFAACRIAALISEAYKAGQRSILSKIVSATGVEMKEYYGTPKP